MGYESLPDFRHAVLEAMSSVYKVMFDEELLNSLRVDINGVLQRRFEIFKKGCKYFVKNLRHNKYKKS